MVLARARAARRVIHSMGTKTSAFGAGKREGHDSSGFYSRGLMVIEETTDTAVSETAVSNEIFAHTAEDMHELPDASVALMVTSPPYHVGKDYDSDASFDEYLEMLYRVSEETYRVLEPGADGPSSTSPTSAVAPTYLSRTSSPARCSTSAFTCGARSSGRRPKALQAVAPGVRGDRLPTRL